MSTKHNNQDRMKALNKIDEENQRKSCPDKQMTKLSDISRKSFRSSEFDTSSRSSSNTFKGDRFIPFRGTHDNFMEEFIINNDLFKEQKNNKKSNNNDQ